MKRLLKEVKRLSRKFRKQDKNPLLIPPSGGKKTPLFGSFSPPLGEMSRSDRGGLFFIEMHFLYIFPHCRWKEIRHIFSVFNSIANECSRDFHNRSIYFMNICG